MSMEQLSLLPPVWPRVITRAWQDPAFRRKLIEMPKAALEEFGVRLPNQPELKIIAGDHKTSVEVSDSVLVLRLPDEPKDMTPGPEKGLEQRIMACSLAESPFPL
jgi:hypothetical protein